MSFFLNSFSQQIEGNGQAVSGKIRKIEKIYKEYKKIEERLEI